MAMMLTLTTVAVALLLAALVVPVRLALEALDLLSRKEEAEAEEEDASPRRRACCVLVLGDFGRSPRMQYHALSLAKAGFDVDVVAYAETLPHALVRDSARIVVHPLTVLPRPHGTAAFLLWAPFKVAIQVAQLLWALLCVIPAPALILQQNPPAIPTLAVAWLASRLRGAAFVVDWHNYGFTLLGMTLGRGHPVVALARMWERWLGARADAAFCVTHAMQRDLATWGVDAVALHDRPAAMFGEATLQQRHELFARLGRGTAALCDDRGRADWTAFTSRAGSSGGPSLRPDRPALLVSSTSWTPDEDFSILLDALAEYDAMAKAATYPRVVCVITGRGPLRSEYERRIAACRLSHVVIETAWLEAADYPVLLGSADLGVSLHRSSSGLDLPMKVVDMFGCGLPVCAVDFNCLHELVVHGENGCVFRDSTELASQLATLLRGFPEHAAALHRLRAGVARTQQQDGWDARWDRVARPVLDRVAGGAHGA